MSARADDAADTPELREAAAERYAKTTDMRVMLGQMADEMSRNVPAHLRDVFESAMKKHVRIDMIEAATKAALGPKFRVHYFAHLQAYSVRPGQIVRTGTPVGRVGDTGNALGKPPHLHFSVVTLLPYPWRIDGSTQGWKKMLYLDPASALGWQRR